MDIIGGRLPTSVRRQRTDTPEFSFRIPAPHFYKLTMLRLSKKYAEILEFFHSTLNVNVKALTTHLRESGQWMCWKIK